MGCSSDTTRPNLRLTTHSYYTSVSTKRGGRSAALARTMRRNLDSWRGFGMVGFYLIYKSNFTWAVSMNDTNEFEFNFIIKCEFIYGITKYINR